MDMRCLTDLSCDFWKHASPFLSHVEVGRLVKTGCHLLAQKMRHGITSYSYRPKLQRRYVVPSLVYSLPNLLALDILIPRTVMACAVDWRLLDRIRISSLPKTLQSWTLQMANGNEWLCKCLDVLPKGALALALPNLTSLTIDSIDSSEKLDESLSPLISLPLARLVLPRSFELLSSHLTLLADTLLYLDITLAFGIVEPIIFPPHLVQLAVCNLPHTYPFADLPRNILDLRIHSIHAQNDDVYEINAAQLVGWPPHLTSLVVYWYHALSYGARLTSAVAQNLPRSLRLFDCNVTYFENARVLSDMPPGLTRCSTMVRPADVEEAIPFLPKQLTTIQSNYLSRSLLWKYLPRTITLIELELGDAYRFNSNSSAYMADLPPSLTRLESFASFFQPTCPVLRNITELSIRVEMTHPTDKWHLFFDTISMQLPNLQSLDVDWGDLIDGALLNVLQQPLKALKMPCDPRTLHFDKQWSKSLCMLRVWTTYFGRPHSMEIDAVKYENRKWCLPNTLTSLFLDQPLIFLSPPCAQQWPPNLVEIGLNGLELNERTKLWTHLPPTLTKLDISVLSGTVDLLGHTDFIDSLQCLAPAMVSFRLSHPLYSSYGRQKLYYNSKGEFCFPQHILDLAKAFPNLARLDISSNGLVCL